MQINDAKQEIILTYEELVELARQGFVSEHFLQTIEKEVGHNLKASTLKVVKTDAPGFMAETKEQMYARTIKEKDAMIASNETYEKFYWITNLEATCKEWCTPELFDYLELDFQQAFSEVRAAAYPIIVSYNEKIFEDNGKYYRVPYLTFSDENASDGMSLLNEWDKPMVKSYYMNNNREVHSVTGEVVEKYDGEQFKNGGWGEFSKKRKQEIQKKRNYSVLSGVFGNIKSKKNVCVMIKNLYTEDSIENPNPLAKMNPEWFKTWEKEKAFANASEAERQAIVEKGRAAIERMSECVMDLSNIRDTVDGRIAHNYQREF